MARNGGEETGVSSMNAGTSTPSSDSRRAIASSSRDSSSASSAAYVSSSRSNTRLPFGRRM
jgi:hypothetical protein